MAEKDHHSYDSEYTEEERDIIGKEAARLRWEFEEERAGKKKVSGNTDEIFQVEASHSMAMLADLDRQVKEAMTKKQESLRELRELQAKLKSNRPSSSVVQTETGSRCGQGANDERESHHSKSRAAPAPPATKVVYDATSTDYQLIQYKIESAKRELEKIDDQIATRKKMYENTLGINTAEVLAILEERDALKKKIASGEYAFSYVEKLELERQVNIAKEQLFAEQKCARKNAEKMQEEIEDLQKTIEDYQSTNQELVSKIEYVEREMRSKAEEAAHKEDTLRAEIRELKNEIEDRKTAEHRLSLDAADKEKSNQELHLIIIEKEKHVSQAYEAKAQFSREKLEEIGNLKAEHAGNIKVLTAQLGNDHKAALSTLEKKKSEEIKELYEKHKSEVSELKSSHCKIIENYCFDIESLKRSLSDEQQKHSDNVRKMKAEFEDELKTAVQKERVFGDEEQSRLVSKEKNLYEDELKRVSSRLNDAIDYEKSQVSELKSANDKLKKEFEEALEKNKHYVAELSSNHESVIDGLKSQHQVELEQLSQRMGGERDIEVGKLCKQIEDIENRFRHLDKDHVDLNTKIDQFFSVFDHHEKTIVCEVNDLCKMIAETLEIDARKVTSKISPMKPHQMLLNPALQKTTTRNCLANMRATATDLINNYGEQQKAIGGLRQQLKDLRKDTEQKLVTLTEHMSIANEKERESLREELEATQAKIVVELQNVIKLRENENDDLRKKLKIMENEVEGLHRSMSKWKEETTQRLSQTFENEMKSLYLRRMREEHEANELLTKQKLLIKLEDQVSRLRAEQALGKSTDQSTVKLINHLQDRIRTLKAETGVPEKSS